MVKYAKEHRIALMAFSICLCVTLWISSGCKKKEQSEGVGQDVPAQETIYTYTSEQGVRLGASGKSDLRILYAGLLKTDRAKDFVAFLAHHFEKVETTGYLTFKETESAGFDVTIIDHDGTDFNAPGCNFRLRTLTRRSQWVSRVHSCAAGLTLRQDTCETAWVMRLMLSRLIMRSSPDRSGWNPSSSPSRLPETIAAIPRGTDFRTR